MQLSLECSGKNLGTLSLCLKNMEETEENKDTEFVGPGRKKVEQTRETIKNMSLSFGFGCI